MPLKKSDKAGFSVIELLIVLAVFGLLAALAYPGYQQFMVRARRVEAQVALLDIMQMQERHFARHNTYLAFEADASDPDARRFRWYSGSSAAVSGYELRGAACPGQAIERCIEVRAIPGTTRVNPRFIDKECQTMTLDSAGRHGATGEGARCWP